MVTAQNRQWWTVAAMALPLVILTIDFFGVVVALPTMGRELGAGNSGLQWVVNAFFLAFAAPLAAVGRLGDLLGRRKVLLIGLVLFSLASMLGGLAPELSWLIAARTLQGFGSAMFFVSSLSIVSNAFPPEQRGSGIGVWSGAGAIGQSVGPLVGGFLTQALSWRWFFFVNIPIALAALVLTALVVTETRDETASGGIDWAGFASVTVGLVLVVLGLQLSNTQGWTSPTVLGVLVSGLAVLALFALIERRIPHPLIEIALFENRDFLGSVAVGFLSNFGFGAVMFFPSLYLQEVLDFTPLQAGLVYLAFTVPFALLSPLAGGAMQRWGARGAMVLGMLLASAAFGILYFVPAGGVPILVVGFLVFGLAAVLAYNVSTTAAQAAIPEQKAGEASGAQNTLRQLATVFGVAVTGALFKGLENARLAELLQQAGASLPPAAMVEIQGLLSGSDAAQARLAALAPTMAHRVEAIVNAAFLYGFAGAMLLCLGVALLGIGAALVVEAGPTR